MGMGLTPLGLGANAGQFFPQVVAQRTTTYPQAMQFDPGLRQFVQNADGSMASIHPVDQKVALALGIENGSIPSATSQGHKIRQLLNRLDPSKRPQVATQEVRRVLADMITAGDVILVLVAVDASRGDSTRVNVTYVNTRLATYNPANPLVGQTTTSF